MQGFDVLATALAAVATFGMLAGFDLVTGGEISWLVNTAVAIGVGVVVLYTRVTTDPAEGEP